MKVYEVDCCSWSSHCNNVLAESIFGFSECSDKDLCSRGQTEIASSLATQDHHFS